MTIASILENSPTHIHQVSSDETVGQVAAKLSEFRIGCVPVTNGRNIEGIFSERDLVYGIAKHGAEMLDKKVSEVTASSPLETPLTYGSVGMLIRSQMCINLVR